VAVRARPQSRAPAFRDRPVNRAVRNTAMRHGAAAAATAQVSRPVAPAAPPAGRRARRSIACGAVGAMQQECGAGRQVARSMAPGARERGVGRHRQELVRHAAIQRSEAATRSPSSGELSAIPGAIARGRVLRHRKGAFTGAMEDEKALPRGQRRGTLLPTRSATCRCRCKSNCCCAIHGEFGAPGRCRWTRDDGQRAAAQ